MNESNLLRYILWQFMFRVMSQERGVEFNFPSPSHTFFKIIIIIIIIIILTVQRRGTSSLVQEPVSLTCSKDSAVLFTCSKIQPCIIIRAAEILLVCDQLARFFLPLFVCLFAWSSACRAQALDQPSKNPPTQIMSLICKNYDKLFTYEQAFLK